MTRNFSNTVRGGITALLTLALMASLLVFMPKAAHGASPIVDPSETGSLTIYKFDGVHGTKHNGEKLDSLPGNKPLADAEFTVYPITGLDLAKNADWAKAQEFIDSVPYAPNLETITDAANAAGLSVGSSQKGTTELDAAGTQATLVFDNLPLGLYYVAETKPPTGYRAVAPFLVTLPMSSGDGSSWNYDVHVYPKDALGGRKQLLSSGSVAVGTRADWMIEAIIPYIALEHGEKLPQFIVRDWLDGTKLSFDHSQLPATVDLVVAGAKQPGKLEEGKHYEVLQTTDYVDVKFTEAGLRVLEKHPGDVVQIVIPTQRKAYGQIRNSATVYSQATDRPYGRASTDDGGVQIPGTSGQWSAVSIYKHVAGEPGTPIAGAEFVVYGCEGCSSFDEATPQSDPATTDADGIASFDEGFRNSDFHDDTYYQPGDPEYWYYWLVETKAPAGYMQLSEPIPFEVTVASGGVESRVYLEVENRKMDIGITLPFTGGVGTTLFVVAGLGVLVATIGIVVVRRRRLNMEAGH